MTSTKFLEERIANYLQPWVPNHGKRSRCRPLKSCDNITMEATEQQTTDKVQLQWSGLIRRKKEPLSGAGHFND